MSDLHIASCVAFVRPEAVESVVRSIAASRIAEVPRHDASGKVVLLIEAPSAARVLDAMDAVRALEGVLAVHLAYQHAESESDLQENA
jgi:nitrate reductase NapD